MSSMPKYDFETFERDSGSFDSEFSAYLNSRYVSGWKYKDCQISSEGGKKRAHCLFKKS
jgi:hypothetical protein